MVPIHHPKSLIMICTKMVIWVYLLFFLSVTKCMTIKQDIEVKTVIHTYYRTVYQGSAKASTEVGSSMQKADSLSASASLSSSTTRSEFINKMPEITSQKSMATMEVSSASSTIESTQNATPTSILSSTEASLSMGIDIDLNSQFSTTFQKIWSRFWRQDKSEWNTIDSVCGGYKEPSLWEQAVVGRAVVFSKDPDKISSTVSNIGRYKNSKLGAFSASTAGDEDIYSDDNAQIAWVYTDAYLTTGNSQYLDVAKGIVQFLMTQVDQNGGVIWKYQNNYIASISTSETALAAIRLYQITRDESLLQFSERCMNFMFKYFQDPSDKLFYDGLDKKDYSNVNRGKLTYTIGTSMSALALIHKSTGDSTWLMRAKEIADAAIKPGSAFIDHNGLWNNKLQYVHLLYGGYADLLAETGSQGEYSKYAKQVTIQGQFVINFLQDPNDSSLFYDSATSATKEMYDRFSKTYKVDGGFSDNPSNHCDGDVSKKEKKILMDNASVAQILSFLGSIQ